MSLDYIAKRLLLFVLIVLVGGTLNFIIPRIRDANPVEQRLYQLAAEGGFNIREIEKTITIYNEKFGLDQPLWVQFVNYWSDLARLDLGRSITFFPASVTGEILRAMPWTIGLLTVSTALAFTMGSLFGAWLSWRKVPRAVKVFVPVLMTFSAVPYYLLGIAMIFLFAVIWPLFPPAGAHSYNVVPSFTWGAISDILYHAILPGTSLILASIGFWGLGMRGIMISTLGEDYMKMAEYKGLKESRIFFRYAVRNAMLPQVTALAIQLALIISGTVLVEVVFAYPGIGNLLFMAISNNDYFLIQGILMFVIVTVGVSLLIVDFVYPLIDPRINYKET